LQKSFVDVCGTTKSVKFCLFLSRSLSRACIRARCYNQYNCYNVI